MLVIEVLGFTLLAICLFSSFYLFSLTIAGLMYRSPKAVRTEPKTKFAIVVPAHNEETLLPRLLNSFNGITYPGHLFKVLVVADNCSDETAEIGRKSGADVFERNDLTMRGKGYALRWLFETHLSGAQEYDSYIFLDADCLVSANFLDVIDAKFQSGSQAVQAYYTVHNALQSPVSALRFLAMALKHYVRPRGRHVLGLSCGLFGTGMAMKRSIIDSYGWSTLSLTEDIEYFLKLTKNGTRVDFAPEAVVWTDMPVSLRSAHSQNLRWEKGRLQMLFKYGPSSFLNGIFKGRVRELDAIIEQAIPPISILALLTLAAFSFSLLIGGWMLLLAVSAALMLAAHLVIGATSAHVPLKIYRAIPFIPAFIIWKYAIYVLALLPIRQEWKRTER